MTDYTELNPETEEQKLTRIRGIRAARALQDAPGLLLHIRALATSGKTERGETLAEWSAPLRITAIDHSDEIYAQLINWVGSWSEALQIAPPSTAVVAWANFREVQGFRAHTTPEGAQILTQLQTMWLAIHAEQIAAHPDAAMFQTDVLDFIGKARGRYPMAPRRPRDVYPRQCPLCDEYSVGAEWASVDVLDVTVSCDHCGHELEAGSPARLLDLVLWAEIPCECRYPGDPKAKCETHPLPTGVTVSAEFERGLRDPENEEPDGTRT